jgi:4-amino-4-deoxy-L-arabinose transferase-like glycosyltransferase
LLALPWVILRFDTSWLFAYADSPIGFIDPWVYFGYFLDFAQHLRTFPGAYFSSRFSWIIPGALAYQLFRPLTAAYVLHVGFYWIALTSLYLVLKHTVSRRAALLSALLMGCHTYFLWAIGWDYVDGAAGAYMLLTLLALTYASKSENPRRWLLASGAALGLAIYCQLFLVTFTPLLPLYYSVARRKSADLRAGLKPFLQGFAALTLLFAIVGLVVNRRPVFFLTSLGTAGKLVVHGNPWKQSAHSWLTTATWLVIPAITLVGAVLILARRKTAPTGGSLAHFWQLYFVLSVAALLFWQMLGQPIFQLYYYVSLLMPAMFLALGGQLAAPLKRLSRWHYGLLCAAAAVVAFSPYVLPSTSALLAYIQAHALVVPPVLGIASTTLLFANARYTRALAVLLLCAAFAMLNATTGPRTWAVHGGRLDPASQKGAFLAVADSVHAVQEIDPKARLYFWYNAEEQLGHLHRSVASAYLWARRLVSESFPALESKSPALHTRVAILSDDPDAFTKADQSLRQAGLSARWITQRQIQEGPFRWSMTVIEVDAGPGSGPAQR